MAHRLAPLLTPRSIAFVGASPKPKSVGHAMLVGAKLGGFTGDLYAVNPKYDDIDGVACYASLAKLPVIPDHAVLGVADHRVEDQMAAAIEAGVKAVTIFGSCYLENDGNPRLVERLAARAREAGLLICGGNGMGFYNNVADTHICASTSPARLPRGRVALVLHSGSAWPSRSTRRPTWMRP